MKVFKSLKYLFTTLTLVIAFAVSVFAGTGVIQFTDIKNPPVTRGKVFSISCKIKSTDVRVKSADITVTYDANMIEFIPEGSTNAEGGAGTVRMNGTGFGKSSGTRTLEFQLKFRATKAGETHIEVSTHEVNDTTDNLVNITKVGSSTIRIKPANTQSKNANLKSLDFSPGELNRDFDASVLSYDTEVNADVDKLVINAQAEDDDATVTENGNENFKIGMNKVTIDVTAPDGKTKKQYTINVTKLENGVTNGTTTIVNGKKFESKPYVVTVMSKPDAEPIPNGYKQLLYEDNEIVAYAPVDNPDGVEPKIFLIYGMDANGNMGFYKYDKESFTLQRYVPEPNSGKNEELEKKNKELESERDSIKKKYGIVFPVTIILAALVILLIVILIVMIVRGGSNKKENEFELDDDDDDDYFSAKPRRMTNSREDSRNDDDLDDDYEFDSKKEDFSDKYDAKYDEKNDDNLDDDFDSEIEDLG